MSINKISTNLPMSDKIEDLNDMIIEVDGKIGGATFDKNELDQVFSDLGLDRKYRRNILIGNTLTDYVNWSVLKNETGYSIWKYTILDYSYDVNNQFFLDNKLLSFKEKADNESASSFDKVYKYDETIEESGESQWMDNTTEASSETGTEFKVLSEIDEYLYLGLSSTFGGIKFEFQTRGSNYNLKIEYFNGAWSQLTANINNLIDNTTNFQSDGAISWDIPSNWITTTVNGQNKYWIRISTTSAPVSKAKAYYIIPNNSVVGLLALSSSQILNEEWAWCSFGSSVYVTIRNTGVSNYEGNFFITSSSSTTNKQNFFIYNHEIKMNYKDSSFSGVSVHTQSGVSIGDMVYINDDYSFDAADADSFAKKAVGVLLSNGVIKYISGLVTNVNTVGSGNIIAGNIIYLSTSSGKVTRIAPNGSGQIQQILGIAISDEQSGGKVDMLMNINLNPILLI